MLRSISCRKSIIVIFVISSISFSFSILAVQFAKSTSDEIERIGSEDITSNAENEAFDLSRIVANKMDSVTTNLQILASGPSVQQGMTANIAPLFDAAQYSTDDTAEFYFWLDEDGKILSASNIAKATYQYISTWKTEKPLFLTEPERTGSIYYSGVIKPADGVIRPYISYPIIYSLQGNEQLEDKFTGVIVAAIRLDALGRLLQNELSPGFESTISLVDKSGIVIYATDKSSIGMSLSDDPSVLVSRTNKVGILDQQVEGIVNAGVQGQTGSKNIAFDGSKFTIGYHPIILNDVHFWTIYILTPHVLNDNVNALLSRQDTFTLVSLSIIGGVSVGIAYLLVTWNKRLESVVLAKTSDLAKANVLLEDSNTKLTSAYEDLKRHDKLQAEFINIAAHELRTPIMPILGITDILDARFGHQDEIKLNRQDFEILSRNAMRLEKLASSVLDVSRIETHSFHIDKSRFDLFEAVNLVVEDARSRSESDKIEFLINAHEGTTVLADRSKIIQVLTNLIENAVRHTDDGIITIDVKTDTDNSNLLVSVADTGTGIDPEIFPRLFEKFASKSGIDRVQAGSGLGLYVSKKIIESHGGRIWAENNSGERGATFFVSLPILEQIASKH